MKIVWVVTDGAFVVVVVMIAVMMVIVVIAVMLVIVMIAVMLVIVMSRGRWRTMVIGKRRGSRPKPQTNSHH